MRDEIILPNLLLILSNELAYSACASLIKGKMAMDVKTCGRISPEKSFDTNRDKYKFIKELPEKQKADFTIVIVDSFR